LSKTRETVWQIASGEVGMVEPRGKNDHPCILIYHQSVNGYLSKMRPVQPYCASFVWYCYSMAGYKPTKIDNPARARDWFREPGRIVLTQQSLRGNRRMMKMPQRGDVVGYIFYGGAISHVEILDKIDLDEGWLWAIGANTSNVQAANSVNREGQGVYYVKRKIKMLHAISDPFAL
jgi:hypothetical protein